MKLRNLLLVGLVVALCYSTNKLLRNLEPVFLNYRVSGTVAKISPYWAPVLEAKLGDITLKIKMPFRPGYTLGSAVCVRKDGVFLTAAHVVTRSPFVGIYQNKRYYQAVVLALDPDLDLALVRVIRSSVTFKAAKIGVSRPVGWPVAAIGNPIVLTNVMTSGIVSTYDHGRLICDAAINPGSSGGGLFDFITGKLIGITTAMITPNGQGSFAGHTVATHADDIQEFLERNLPLCGL